MAKTNKRRGKTVGLETTLSVDRMGRSIVRFPDAIPTQKGEKFVLKMVGKHLILLSKTKPIRSQTVMRLDLQRWKLNHA